MTASKNVDRAALLSWLRVEELAADDAANRTQRGESSRRAWLARAESLAEVAAALRAGCFEAT